jgi:serine/threonine protein kinase
LNLYGGRQVNWSPSSSLSAPCKDIIKKLLTKNPALRLGSVNGGVAKIKQHPWFAVREDRILCC